MLIAQRQRPEKTITNPFRHLINAFFLPICNNGIRHIKATRLVNAEVQTKPIVEILRITFGIGNESGARDNNANTASTIDAK